MPEIPPMKTVTSSIEPLESRIAPAAVTLAYTDIDGDKVKITDSTGTLTVGELSFIGGGANGQLSLLDLTAAGFAGKGANLTFTVTKAAGGDGLAARRLNSVDLLVKSLDLSLEIGTAFWNGLSMIKRNEKR